MLSHLAEQNPPSANDVISVRCTADILLPLLSHRKVPPAQPIRELILKLHDILLNLPVGPAQNCVARLCEWLWNVKDPNRDQAVPQVLLFLLLRSFGDESHFIDGNSQPGRGSAAYVRRVFALRKAFNVLELSVDAPQSVTVRKLLLRCGNSAVYLQNLEGRKFLAFLMSLEDIRDSIFSVLISQLAAVRKSVASLFGNVFLIAWKTNRADWLADRLMNITEKAICAGTQPFGTNLRTVLSSFHFDKRAHDVELLLHNIYTPILYSHLMVANPIVRRNAVIIMADAFPIHDPGATMEDIQNSINSQCNKFVELLQDPSPIVRKAAVQGVCRILALLWDIIPVASIKKMIDFIASKLAFDASSAPVRVAVFEGLEFLLRNHLARPLLATILPQLGKHIHDTSEKVRLSFMDLLLSIKSKRIRELRYFDVVPVEELLLRLPMESEAIAAKIMSLIVTSYFPLERPGKSSEELAASQTRAYLAMVDSSEEAASRFYKHVNMYVPPGPLCEFAMRLTAMALDGPLRQTSSKNCMNASQGGSRRRRRKRKGTGKENTESANSDAGDNGETKTTGKEPPAVSRETILCTVADVLVSMSPTLAKEINKDLREYIDEIYDGGALKPLLVERGNTKQSRAACWRIASCVSPSSLKPVKILWREQLDSILEWRRGNVTDVLGYKAMLSSLVLCGLRWKMLSALSAVLSGWAECASSGLRTSRVSHKVSKRTQAKSWEPDLVARLNSLFGLQAFGSIILEEDEIGLRFGGELTATEDESEPSKSVSIPNRMLSAMRKGFMGALDFVLEDNSDRSAKENYLSEMRHLLIRTLELSMKASLSFSIRLKDEAKTFQEFREILISFANDDLWQRVSHTDSGLFFSMSKAVLSHCADVVVVRECDEEDLQMIERIAGTISNLAASEKLEKTTPVSMQLLRISYHIGERGDLLTHVDEPPLSSTEKGASMKSMSLRIARVGMSLLKDLLDEENDIVSDSKPLNNFLRAVLQQRIEFGEQNDVLDCLQKYERRIEERNEASRVHMDVEKDEAGAIPASSQKVNV